MLASFESIISDMDGEQPFAALDKEGLDEATRIADSGLQRQRQGLDTRTGHATEVGGVGTSLSVSAAGSVLDEPGVTEVSSRGRAKG